MLEIVSPEEDVILVRYRKVINRRFGSTGNCSEFYSNTSIKYVSQFEVSMGCLRTRELA